MDLERILFLLRKDGWSKVRENTFMHPTLETSWWARVYRPHGFAPYIIEVSEVYFRDANPYLKTGHYFFFHTESEYDTFAISEIRYNEIKLWESSDLDRQELFINDNLDELKKMPHGEDIVQKALTNINNRRTELLNNKYRG